MALATFSLFGLKQINVAKASKYKSAPLAEANGNKTKFIF